jgi:hypothetical protein
MWAELAAANSLNHFDHSKIKNPFMGNELIGKTTSRGATLCSLWFVSLFSTPRCITLLLKFKTHSSQSTLAWWIWYPLHNHLIMKVLQTYFLSLNKVPIQELWWKGWKHFLPFPLELLLSIQGIFLHQKANFLSFWSYSGICPQSQLSLCEFIVLLV